MFTGCTAYMQEADAQQIQLMKELLLPVQWYLDARLAYLVFDASTFSSLSRHVFFLQSRMRTGFNLSVALAKTK